MALGNRDGAVAEAQLALRAVGAPGVGAAEAQMKRGGLADLGEDEFGGPLHRQGTLARDHFGGEFGGLGSGDQELPLFAAQTGQPSELPAMIEARQHVAGNEVAFGEQDIRSGDRHRFQLTFELAIQPPGIEFRSLADAGHKAPLLTRIPAQGLPVLHAGGGRVAHKEPAGGAEPGQVDVREGRLQMEAGGQHGTRPVLGVGHAD